MTTAVETPPEGAEKAVEGKQEGKTFTQADVDRIVTERLARQAKNDFGDYDELKKTAAGAKTLEDRLGSLEAELTTSKTEALRARIAAEFGISTKKGEKGEPSDADLFLTGTDEATVTAQAERLGVKVADQKKQGNVAPKEGAPTTTGDGSQDLREVARRLFNRSD
jgi:hypothetical protein